MAHETPLITVGITAYNAANTIERALNSALAQSWRPIEIVAVDDCSTDSTRELLDRLEKQHSELRVYSNDVNSGVAVSRNRILSEAKGEFVVFFDDDDESLPQRVKEQYKRIVNYEKEYAAGTPVICHTTRRVRYPHGVDRLEPTMGQTSGTRAPNGIAVAKRILMGAPLKDGYGACPTCSQMARLSTYQLLNGFDPKLRRSEDTDFNIRLAVAGGHFVGIGDPLVIQTMTPTSEKSLSEEYRNLVLLVEKHRSIIENEGQYEFCRRWIDMKQLWLEGRRKRFILALSALGMIHPVLTMRRLLVAFPTLGINRAFSRFHSVGNTSLD